MSAPIPGAADAGEPCENYAPIFRRGMGIVIEAVDALRAEIAKSGKLSASVRRYDEALSQMLDHMAQDSRVPWLILDYKGAADVSNCMGYGIKHMVRALAPLAKPERERAALATATGTAKTAQPVECEASQSGGEAVTPNTSSTQSDGRGL